MNGLDNEKRVEFEN